MSPLFQVKHATKDEYLTFDLGTQSIYWAAPSSAYGFIRGEADRLAALHGGVVGVLSTTWTKGWKATRTWTPAAAEAEAKILHFPAAVR